MGHPETARRGFQSETRRMGAVSATPNRSLAPRSRPNPIPGLVPNVSTPHPHNSCDAGSSRVLPANRRRGLEQQRLR